MSDERLEQIEKELDLIKQRNMKVEADKAWEVSSFRIRSICALTYIVAALFLLVIGSERFWLNALVPAIGFYLSSQSLPVIKKWWIDSSYQNSKK